MLKKRKITEKIFREVWEELKEKGCIAPELNFEIKLNSWGGYSYYLTTLSGEKLQVNNLAQLILQALLNTRANRK